MPTRVRTAHQWMRRILRRLAQQEARCAWNGEDPAPLRLAALIVEFAAQGDLHSEAAAARIVFPRSPWPPPPAPAFPSPNCSGLAPRPGELVQVDGRTGWQWAEATADYLRFRSGRSWRNPRDRNLPIVASYSTAERLLREALNSTVPCSLPAVYLPMSTTRKPCRRAAAPLPFSRAARAR